MSLTESQAASRPFGLDANRVDSPARTTTSGFAALAWAAVASTNVRYADGSHSSHWAWISTTSANRAAAVSIPHRTYAVDVFSFGPASHAACWTSTRLGCGVMMTPYP